MHLHGLGAAIAPTITIAAQLVLESGGALSASASTSTETLLDRSIEQGGAHEDEGTWTGGRRKTARSGECLHR